jgi:hypothetical protein
LEKATTRTPTTTAINKEREQTNNKEKEDIKKSTQNTIYKNPLFFIFVYSKF